jgi:hypothetical protein
MRRRARERGVERRRKPERSVERAEETSDWKRSWRFRSKGRKPRRSKRPGTRRAATVRAVEGRRHRGCFVRAPCERSGGGGRRRRKRRRREPDAWKESSGSKPKGASPQGETISGARVCVCREAHGGMVVFVETTRSVEGEPQGGESPGGEAACCASVTASERVRIPGT